MSNFVVAWQARRDLYFGRGKRKVLFMKKGEIRTLPGIRTVGPNGGQIEHSDENFRLFVPLDSLRINRDEP